jgi:hypothetical protein
MLHHIKKLFGFGPKAEAQPVVESAPYKVPEPAATTPIPLVAEQASQAVIESIVPAKKKPAAKKPRAPKAPK